MLGQQSKAQKEIARGKGWDPDKVFDPKTGTYGPLIEGSDPSAVFTNQGVPMTKGKYPQLKDGYDVRSIGADEVDFVSPDWRGEERNDPTPGVKGNPFAGMGKQ